MIPTDPLKFNYKIVRGSTNEFVDHSQFILFFHTTEKNSRAKKTDFPPGTSRPKGGLGHRKSKLPFSHSPSRSIAKNPTT